MSAAAEVIKLGRDHPDKAERTEMAVEAIADANSLARTLQLLLTMDDSAYEEARMALAMRIEALTSIALSTFGGDDNRQTAEMREVLAGHAVLQLRALIPPGFGLGIDRGAA
jgi:hypothetical protein